MIEWIGWTTVVMLAVQLGMFVVDIFAEGIHENIGVELSRVQRRTVIKSYHIAAAVFGFALWIIATLGWMCMGGMQGG